MNVRVFSTTFATSAPPTVTYKRVSAIEMNGIHQLNWGSTRMAGFLDACMQALKIIVTFLNTIISSGIRPDETKYIASSKSKHYFICYMLTHIFPVLCLCINP